MRKARVIVSHPGKQHVHQLCYGLQKSGLLHHFYTSVWLIPDNIILKCFLLLCPSRIADKFIKTLKKRYFKPLDSNFIIQFPYLELIRQLLNGVFKLKSERWIFYVERAHDWYVSFHIKKENPDIVIGYEKAALLTFKKTKALNKVTILDLAQVHYSHIRSLRRDYPEFKAIMPSDYLFETINKVKEEEYKYVDYIITLSNYAKQSLIDANIPEEKIYTVNLGFDPDVFNIKSMYTKQGAFKILFVGTITKRKGIHLILEALKQLNLQEVEFTIVGPMDDGADILDKYKGLFNYVPFLHHNELVKYYQNADVFVFPSLLDSWAMTVVEAMACGTPVIVSEHTGSKDVVKKGGGFIIPVNDVNALSSKIMYLYQNRNELEIIGRKAHEISRMYIWENYYKSINMIIEQVHSTKIL